MEVRITKGSGWYANRIGEVFKVDEQASYKESYYPIEMYQKVLREGYGAERSTFYFIEASDCEINKINKNSLNTKDEIIAKQQIEIEDLKQKIFKVKSYLGIMSNIVMI